MKQHHYKPQMEWMVEREILRIRFSRVPPAQFGALLRRLQSSVSEYKWNAEKHFWEIPITDIQKVAVFAEQMFGQDSMHYVGKGQLPKQMELPIND